MHCFHDLLLLSFLHATVLFSHCYAATPVDNTLVARATGSSVVETVCTKLELQGSNFTYNEIRFLRRLAYVESTDGNDTMTFRQGYYGGIWQVDHGKFIVFKDWCTTNSQCTSNIIQQLGITIQSLSWRALLKPLYSALVAKLYFTMISSSIPSSIEDQATTVWQRYYRTDLTPDTFINKAYQLETFKCNSIGSDILFLVNLPNNTGQELFVSTVVADVVNDFTTGKNQFGLVYININYSGDPVHDKVDTYFRGFTSANTFISAMNITIFAGTNAADPLNNLDFDHLRLNFFTPSNRARLSSGGTPKVAITIPFSAKDESLTNVAAAENYYSNITSIAVTQTATQYSQSQSQTKPMSYSNPNILFTIGSTLNSSDAAEVAKIKYLLKRKICAAPVVISSTQSVTIDLPANVIQNCKVLVPQEGGTVQVSNNGGVTTFYISFNFFPNENYYDDNIVVQPGQTGSIDINFIRTNSPHLELDVNYVYCAVASDSINQKVSLNAIDEAPLVTITETDNSPSQVVTIPSGSHQKCTINIKISAKNYKTVQISTLSGGTLSLYVSSSNYINEYYYDNATTSQPGKTGVVYIDTTDYYNQTGHFKPFYCYILGDKYQSSQVVVAIIADDKDTGVCQHSHCQNGGSCIGLTQIDYTCACMPSFTGQYCEKGDSYVSKMNLLLIGIMLIAQRLFQ